MRHLQTIYNSNYHRRYNVQINPDEATILHALISNALRHTPHHESTTQFLNRCQDMTRCLKHLDQLPPTTL